MSYRIVDWSEKQHYKDRNPPWIKLHRKILTSYKYSRLSIASKALAPLLWVLASESDDIKSGIITSDVNELSFKVHIDKDTIEKSVNELIENGFIEVVAGCNQDASKLRQNSPPETETETETDTCASAKQIPVMHGFEQFWSSYPKKKNKGDAEKAWRVIKPDSALVPRLIEAVEAAKRCSDWLKDGGKYIPYPASWLRAKGWEDGDILPSAASAAPGPKPGDKAIINGVELTYYAGLGYAL